MARLQHTVVLEPVTRAWFDQAAGIYFDWGTEYLTELGDPPAAEVQYEMPDSPTKVHLDSWQRDGEIAARWWKADSEGAVIGTARLDSPGSPRTAEVTADYRGAGLVQGWLTKVSGTLQVDMQTWWNGTARQGIDPAVAGRFRQTFAHGGGTIAVAPAPGGRWEVTVRVTVHGRGLLRPVGAMTFLFARGKLKRLFAKMVTEFAQSWNKEVPRLRTMTPDELRELINKEPTEAAP